MKTNSYIRHENMYHTSGGCSALPPKTAQKYVLGVGNLLAHWAALDFMMRVACVGYSDNGQYTRCVRIDSEQFKYIVFSLNLELLGSVPFEVLPSTFYTSLPAFLPVLETFMEYLFWNTA
jgi:hypothetical protein